MKYRKLALALLALPASAPGATEPDPWLEVRTPHFVVISNAGEEQARGVSQHALRLSGAVVDSRARAILVWREDEKQQPAAAQRLGIGVVRSVDDCINVLTQLHAPPEEQPGLMDRVMYRSDESFQLLQPARLEVVNQR